MSFLLHFGVAFEDLRRGHHILYLSIAAAIIATLGSCAWEDLLMRDTQRQTLMMINQEKRRRLGHLSGPISHNTAILSLRYPISRDTFSGRLVLPQNGAIPPPWHLVSHRHICAIPHFATYRAIIGRYPTKTSTKEFCETIAASIARYEKYRYWP